MTSTTCDKIKKGIRLNVLINLVYLLLTISPLICYVATIRLSWLCANFSVQYKTEKIETHTHTHREREREREFVLSKVWRTQVGEKVTTTIHKKKIYNANIKFNCVSISIRVQNSTTSNERFKHSVSPQNRIRTFDQTLHSSIYVSNCKFVMV